MITFSLLKLPSFSTAKSKTSVWQQNVIVAEEKALKKRHNECERLLKSMRAYVLYSTKIGRTEVGFQFTNLKEAPCNWNLEKGIRFYRWPTMISKELNQWIIQNPKEFTQVVSGAFHELTVTSAGTLCEIELNGQVLFDNVKVLNITLTIP